MQATFSYIVPEIDGVELVMSFQSNRPYSSFTHYSNQIFNKYDFVTKDQFPTAYAHLKLVLLDEKKERIIHIPEKENYLEAFKDFRRVMGSEYVGVDISFHSSIIEKIMGEINQDVAIFNLYFYPDSSAVVKTSYTKEEIIHDKITRLETAFISMRKEIEINFEVMKRDLEMRLGVMSMSKRRKDA